MATTRIMPLHVGKGRTEGQAISDIIDYVANPHKTDHGKLITGYDCDRKFRNFLGSTKAVRRLSDTICTENGLSIVENPKPHGKSYNKWLGDQAKPSHREQLRVCIDNALAQHPANLDELLKLLQESGCEVSRRGKSYRLKLPEWDKVARLDSLGEGYGLEDLLAVLSGQKEHTPRKKATLPADPPKVNLLVDIQAKLQAGKGAGYAHWAKVFNLKQMAQTMNYLSEHTSNTGSTAQYARMLGELVRLPVFSLSDATRKLGKQTEIIYLGWVMASQVKEYAKAAKRFRVRAVVAVGMAATGSSDRAVREKNQVPDRTPVFILQGNFQVKRLHGLYRLMMEIMVKSVGKALNEKENRTADKDDMLDMMLHGGNRVTAQNLRALEDWAISQRGDRA